MDKIQKAQMFGNQHDEVPSNRFKKILQINPNHKINQIILQRIKVFFDLIQNDETNDELEQLIYLLFETAAFNSGFAVADPNDFANRYYKTYSQAMGVLNLQRNQIEVQDVELDDSDF